MVEEREKENKFGAMVIKMMKLEKEHDDVAH